MLRLIEAALHAGVGPGNEQRRSVRHRNTKPIVATCAMQHENNQDTEQSNHKPVGPLTSQTVPSDPVARAALALPATVFGGAFSRTT